MPNKVCDDLFYCQDGKLYVRRNLKGLSVFARRAIEKGELICEYKGELCEYRVFRRRHYEYNKTGKGSYILEFKFKEKRWAIDATKDNKSFGRLINHSRQKQNIKPVVGDKKGKPFVYFVAVSNIPKDQELLYDYGDNCETSKHSFPWLKE